MSESLNSNSVTLDEFLRRLDTIVNRILSQERLIHYILMSCLPPKERYVWIETLNNLKKPDYPWYNKLYDARSLMRKIMNLVDTCEALEEQ